MPNANAGAVLVLVPTQSLTNAAADYYTAPVGPPNLIVKVKGIIFTNFSAAAHTVTLHNRAVGVATADANKVIGAAAIPANTSWVIEADDYFLVMLAGGILTALADAGAVVNMSISGEVIS